MATCFMIQPFDSGKFDKRFEDVFEPAIAAANLDAYRVDRDPSVEIPIDAIEAGIRSASVCLADISADNPNVWYELGYAFARGRPVVMVCSSERAKFPFDIQHRSVIRYLSESVSDFEVLRTNITDRILALLDKGEALRQFAEKDQVAAVSGLRQAELIVLAALAGTTFPTENSTSLRYLKSEAESAGLTAVGFSIGVRRLKDKQFIETFDAHDRDGDIYDAVRMSDLGWSWMERNEDKFIIRREKNTTNKSTNSDFADDIPF